MKRRKALSSAAGAGVILSLVAVTPQVASSASANRSTASDSCLNTAAPLSVEESRLSFRLPDNDNPAVLQDKTFAQQMIEGAGFEQFGPDFVNRLCRAHSLSDATNLAMARGQRLWQMAVDRAQRQRAIEGDLPYSDDRPLYWVRLQTTAALRQWSPSFRLFVGDRLKLIETFDRASRGMFDIAFRPGSGVKRVIVSGFDPYTLDGGDAGTAPGAAGNNLRHGNPSGATALSIDGTRHKTADGKWAFIEAYTLPVNFPEFERGYLEDTVGPYMRPGPRQVDASITVSQAGGSVFNLEEWNARYHGVSLGNDRFRPCPAVNGQPQLAVNNPGCNSVVVDRWGGPVTFDLDNPPQWTRASLPVAAMIAANTGANVPRPPGDTWPDPSVAFGVVWHTNYTQFPDCTSTTRETFNSPPPVEYPPPTQPIPPAAESCSYSGGGGNYLSNESAYRNTLLRDRVGIRIPAGHIHTPSMQHFETLYDVSDATFDAWRLAIAAQATNLIHVVADEAKRNTWPEFQDDRTRLLKTLVEPVEHCFQQHDTVDSGSAMFDGCYDWHSAVHGAYSLHVLYRVTGDPRYLQIAESKINPAAVPAELAYMRSTIRNRENPYGFSWLLALVREREQATGETDLRPLADEAVARIRELVDSLTPEQARQRVLVPNYPNVSWALIHLDLWAEHTGDAGLAAYARQKAKAILIDDTALDDLCPVSADTPPDHREFFPPCLMRLAAVAQTWSGTPAELRTWTNARVQPDFWVPPVTDPVRNHSHALNFSRSYALWHLWQATGNERFRENYIYLLRYQIGRPDLWALNSPLGYDVSHWVAQFGIRAIAESNRR